MSIRRRLISGILALLVIAVLATDVVTYSSLRSFLVGRLDEQIYVAQDQGVNYIEDSYVRDSSYPNSLAKVNPTAWLARLGGTSLAPSGEGETSAAAAAPAAPIDAVPGGVNSPTSRRPPVPTAPSSSARADRPHLNGISLSERVSPDVFVIVTTPEGRTLYARPSGSAKYQDPMPILSAGIPVQKGPEQHRFGGTSGPYEPDQPSFTMTSVGSSGTQYRAQAVSVPGGILITAMPLTPVLETLASVVHVEIIVSVVVLLAAIFVTLAVVRLGLRPLDDMTETAGAIAAGDLTRRIRRSDEHSEVGRLGRALNGMLSQIEAAFGQRKASEDRLRRFAADASHELRTPLTSIRGYAELLRKDAFTDDESRRRAATRIEREAARLGVMVDDLLLLARLDQGRPLEREPVDLRQVVREAVDDVRVVHPERDISLDASEPLVVEGDGGRLRQVVDNLVRNAVVHTPASTPVRVSVGREEGREGQGSRALVVVEDEGPGLDPEQAAHVFERFYRSSPARTGEGSGLGLSIVAAIAEAHGGSAAVKSTPGQGATFTVWLPISVNGGGEEETGGDHRLADADMAVPPTDVEKPSTDVGHAAPRAPGGAPGTPGAPGAPGVPEPLGTRRAGERQGVGASSTVRR